MAMTTPERFWRPVELTFRLILLLTVLLPALVRGGDDSSGGAPSLFSGQTDIGAPQKAGTLDYNPVAGVYTIGGAGANIWAKADSFHFVWEKFEGNVALAADISFLGTGGNPHRKAVLMIRQTLDPDSSYVDAALHGNGLASLQFRESAGDVTHEVQAVVTAPRRLCLEKSGDTLYLLTADADGVLHPTGCSVKLHFKGACYVGLGVCAHDADAFEKVTFSRVTMGAPVLVASRVVSSLETMAIASGDRRCIYYSGEVIASPHIVGNGSAVLCNEDGHIAELTLQTLGGGRPPSSMISPPRVIDTGSARKIESGAGLTPDGKTLILTDTSHRGGPRIYTQPLTGGALKQITPLGPSWWHGISPDGRTLVYAGKRHGKFGIFTISVEGGTERRLTTTDALDDGPDYSPDGRWIYFNSDRTGHMQLWRMNPDGGALEQITKDEANNWFPHPSPDGKWLLFLAGLSRAEMGKNPHDQEVMLKIAPVSGGRVDLSQTRILARFNGGVGTIDVPSWSGDSALIAYVRYQPQP
jgi:TolB protein